MQQNIKVELEAQDEVGEAYRKAYRFFNLSLDMLVIGNLDGYFIDLNPAWERILGFTAEELTAQPFIEFIHPEDWAKTTAEMGKLAEGIPLTDFENRYRCKDGSYKYLAWTAFPFLEEGLIYAVARDVTEYKQAQEALYQREQEFRALAENSPDIISRIDKQMRHLYVNAAIETATGISPQVFIGKTHRDLGIPEDLCTYWQEHLQQVFITKRERIVEFDFLTPEGTTRNYQSRLVPEFALNGSIESILGVARDVTEYKQTEAALRKNQRLLQEILDAAPMDIFLKDLQGRYILINRSGENTTGLGRDQVIGKTDYDLFPAEIADAFQANDSAVLEAGKPVESEQVVPQADGLHTVIAIKFPLYDSSGDPYAICGLATDITQRKRSEEALYRRKQEFKALAENAPDIITRFDKQMRYLYVNAAVEAASGLAPQAFIGKTNREVGMSDSLCSYWEENYQQVLATGCERIVEFDFQAPDGTTRHYQTRMVPEFALDGSVESMLTVARDVTKFKETEKALRESQQLLQALLDAAPMAIYLKDLQGRYLLCNRYTLGPFGLNSEQVIGKNLYDFFPSEIADLFQISDRAALEAGGPVELEEVFAEPDGLHTYITTKFPLYDTAFNPYAVCGISTDITQRKLAETALFESEERFRQLAENIEAIFWVCSLDGEKMLYVSPAYEKIWGCTTESLYEQPQSWQNAIHPEDFPLVTAAMELHRQGEFPEREYRIVRPDGSIRWIQDRVFPVRNNDGKVYRLTGIAQDITERKLAETALFESEERFRQLAENIDAVFWIFSLEEQRMLYVSPAYEKIWGRSPQTLQEHPETWLLTIHPEDRDKMPAKQQQVIRGQYLEDTYRIIRPDGSIRWIQDRVFPVRNNDGQVYRLAGIAQDITERKLAETALFESEERFRQLAENINAVFWIFSLEEQRMLYVSPAYEKIWGRSSQLLFENSQNWLLTIHPEDRGKVATVMYERLIPGHLIEETYRIIKPDGSVRWINDRAFPIYNSQGKLYRAAGIAEDITERILTEVALQESEQKYRNLVETSQGLIWSLDRERRFTFVNQAVRQISGYEPEEIIGQKFTEFTTPEQAQKNIEVFERVFAGESILQYEAEFLRKDGTPYWISCNMMALRDDTGKIIGITGTAVDITERKKAEEQLKLSLQEKEALLKEVHHRVKNNLQVISSLLDLQSQQIQDPVTLELFRASQNRVKSISLIHEKLYQSENLARVNLAEYIQSLTNYLLQTYPIDPNNITLHLQVQQIFLNLDIVIPCGLIINELVSNALKHGFPGNTKGTIWVCLNSVCLASTEKKGQQFTLVIGNNGMKLQDSQKVYRPKSLGFQLVNALVKQLQGTIEITPSPGTEFKIKFSDINH